jgi:DNA-binding transcriptional LysR family regulator
MHDFQEVRNTESITEVSIGALDRINCFALSGFYRNILKTRPDIRIDTHTRHSKGIYRMMENRQLDLGLVSSLLPVHNLIITPLYYEIMFVVSSAESQLPKIVRPEDLDPSKEVYSRWSGQSPRLSSDEL